MGKERRERKGNGAVSEPGLVERDCLDVEVVVGKAVGSKGKGEEAIDAQDE